VALLNSLASIRTLPAMPLTALKLVRALNGQALDAAELEKIVRNDEAIAMSVLSIANSAGGGGAPGRVFTLQESIARLGTRRLQQIALQHECSRLLDEGGRSYGLRRGELWRGSVTGALAAEAIAKRTRVCEPGLAFVAALLRDIGKLALDHVAQPDELDRAFCGGDVSRGQLALEREVFGRDHAEIGEELARLWRLPDRIAAAIRWHHAPPPDPAHDVLIDVVHVADAVRSWMGAGLGTDGLCYEVDRAAVARLGLDAGAIELLMAQAQAEAAALVSQAR
jgi:HD-like signal output (HDOD) protein